MCGLEIYREAWCIVPPSFEATRSMCFDTIRTTEEGAWMAEATMRSKHDASAWARWAYCEAGLRAIPITIASR